MTAGARERRQGIGGTSTRAAPWLAWSLAGLCVAMFLASVLLLRVIAFSSQEPTSTGGTLGDLLIFVSFLAFPVVVP